MLALCRTGTIAQIEWRFFWLLGMGIISDLIVLIFFENHIYEFQKYEKKSGGRQ
jgi:hypothetical protein